MAATEARGGPGRTAFTVARVGAVVGAYGAASIAVLATIFVLRAHVSPRLLQSALGFVFIATLSAGLEPGTVKASAIRSARGETGAAPGAAAILAAAAVKALVAAPVLALIWRFADPGIDAASLLWLPLIAFAGFSATELRVLLDLGGRHARAVCLKQGSLAGGIAVVAALLLLGVSLAVAIGVSSLARVALTLAAAPRDRAGSRTEGLTTEVRGLLADIRWGELAGLSVLAALGGSTDRILGLRYLTPATYAGYAVVYETLSKFWLLPYLFTPIIFARTVGGGEAARFIRRAWVATLAAGVLFVLAVAAIVAVAPGRVDKVIGASFGAAPIAFAAAVVIGALTQMRIARMQGAGEGRRAMVITGLSALFAAAVYFLAIHRLGAPGLLYAWLVKSAVEFAATWVGGGGESQARR